MPQVILRLQWEKSLASKPTLVYRINDAIVHANSLTVIESVYFLELFDGLYETSETPNHMIYEVTFNVTKDNIAGRETVQK